MDPLPPDNFVTSCIHWQLENIDSPSYAYLPEVNTFHYTISKTSHLLKSLLISSEKPSSQIYSAGYKFSEILIFSLTDSHSHNAMQEVE